jgi:hypothetical protein
MNTIIVKNVQSLAEDVLMNALKWLSHNEAHYPHDQDFCNKQSAIKTILKLKEAAIFGSLYLFQLAHKNQRLELESESPIDI